MLSASECKERAIITQHTTTKIRILRVVFLNIRPFKLRFVPRLARESTCFFVTFCRSFSKYFLSIYKIKANQSIVTIQPYSFISCRIVQANNSFWIFPTTYFMSGVRPIKSNIQNALCEQAPNSVLYIRFCMAELLQSIS